MAISGGDGSIILTTKVDQSGLNKGMTSMQKGVKSLSSSFKALGSTIAAVFSITAIINFSKQAGEFATQTEASVQRLADIYGEATQSVGDFIDANARAIGMSKSAGASIAATYGNLLSVWADQATNAELTNSLLNQTAVVASKTGRTTTDVAERIRSGLLGNTEAIEDLGINVNIKTIEITDAFKRIADGRSWEQLNAYEQSQVRTLAILEQSTNKYGTTVAETTATVRNQYQAAYEDFQNTWGQVVNTVLIPVLKILTQVFTIATKGLQVMAGLSGKTIENSGETSNNIKKQTKEQEKLNKAVKKGLAGFDEINILTEQSAKNTADSGTGTQNLGIGGSDGNYDNSFVNKIDTDLAAIMMIVGFALAAIGIILICFGQILWGIGFIIAGAFMFSASAAALSENKSVKKVRNTISAIIAIGSILLLVIGIILCCTGVALPLGIGMIIAGAVGLVTVVALNWDFIKNKAIEIFQSIVSWVKTWGLLVLGIILTLSGNLWLGIPLIKEGAKSLTEAQNPAWLAILDKLKEVWGKIRDFWNRNIAPIFTAKWWSDLGKKAINGLLGVIESGLNFIINKINEFISGISDVVGAVGEVIGQDWSIRKIPNVKIPRLAQGAVIPGGREFMAILGDQPKGQTNIEAPLQTIVDAMNIALAQNGGANSGNTEVVLEIDGREFGRAVVEQGNKENRRIGTRLVIA